MQKTFFFLFFLTFPLITVSCLSVHQADLNAWRGVPVIELESQPVFSAMELKKTELSNGSTMWNYTQRGGSYSNCYSNTQGHSDTTRHKNDSHRTPQNERYGYNRSEYDRYGYNRSGYDRYGYNRSGYDRYGYNRSGHNRSGYNRRGTTQRDQRRSTEHKQVHQSTNTSSNCVTGEYICNNQFLVDKKGIIQWYRPTGNSCYTNCSYRPASQPCQN